MVELKTEKQYMLNTVVPLDIIITRNLQVFDVHVMYLGTYLAMVNFTVINLSSFW